MRTRAKYASFRRRLAFWVRLAGFRSTDELTRAAFIEGYLEVPIGSFIRLGSMSKIKERVAEMAATDLGNPKYKVLTDSSWIFETGNTKVFDNVRAYIARAASSILRSNLTIKDIDDKVPDLEWHALFLPDRSAKPVAYSAGELARSDQLKSPASVAKLIGVLGSRGIGKLSKELHKLKAQQSRGSELAKIREESLSGDASEKSLARLRRLEKEMATLADQEIHVLDKFQVSPEIARKVVDSLEPLFVRLLSRRLAAIATTVFERLLVDRENLKDIRDDILGSGEIKSSSWANMMNTIKDAGPKIQQAILRGLESVEGGLSLY